MTITAADIYSIRLGSNIAQLHECLTVTANTIIFGLPPTVWNSTPRKVLENPLLTILKSMLMSRQFHLSVIAICNVLTDCIQV